MAHNNSSEGRKLKREIGFVALLFTAVTGIIGSGWLFASLYAAQYAGPGSIISWVIGGGISIVLTLVFAEMGGMVPVAGAIARIPYFSHGTLSSFTAGWLCWIAYVTTAPIEVTAILDYSSNYLPSLTVNEHGERVLTNLCLGVATALMLLMTVVNMLGVKWLARANTAITIWKILVPITVALVLIAVGFNSGNLTNFGGFSPNGPAGIFAAVSSGGIMFCFFGFRLVMDLAGEAKNPGRDVPLAMIGAVLISLIIYMLLQVAFLGVIPLYHLQNGWSGITENIPGGPFAAFAAMLGLSWLAVALYIDAVVSPAGTGLTYVGATSRILYAMSKNRQYPEVFEKLNRFNVPIWSLLFNFAAGMFLFLPFPGWDELVSFISSAIVLSFAYGPVSMAALRYQMPDYERPFRLPFGIALSAISFVFVGFVVYWTGWETNWKVFLLAIVGIGVMGVMRAIRGQGAEPLHLRQGIWMLPYLIGLGAISYLGTFEGGLGLLSQIEALVIITVFSLVIFWLAVKLRLPDADAKRLIGKAEK
ncbi:APC family permease [Desulfobacterota bacterium AH_259_B03_O07]|nr:APC family permease [Desulfobacterota bacterium AH_259_B03_O07]